MKRIHFHIIGSMLALFIGIARAFGGFTLLFSHANPTEAGVATGLVIVGAWLIIVAITFLINMSQKTQKPQMFIKALSIGMAAFWIDGVINGFLLYGAPQLSGQIINTSLLIIVLACLWAKRHKA